jgi:RNA polymerase sigma-70 factor (ECF subfamily)
MYRIPVSPIEPFSSPPPIRPDPLPSDRQLLDRLRAGGEDAFDVVFRAHYALLVGFVERMVRQREVAEEIAQDVLLELWKRREGFVLEVSLRAYLFKAARNRALNHLRHERVARLGESHAAGDAVVEPLSVTRLVDEEIDLAVREAVRGLPERCREVFELSRVQGLRYGEIAAVMGISVKTVEAQMGKALRVLRERLAPWLPEDGG